MKQWLMVRLVLACTKLMQPVVVMLPGTEPCSVLKCAPGQVTSLMQSLGFVVGRRE
jgi:hypothetical protein